MKYVCQIYGKPQHSEINKVRYEIFIDSYKERSHPFEALKNFEGINLPPCRDVIHCKVKRTNQIVSIWRFAHSTKPKFLNPIENGWYLDSNWNEYAIKWFSGPQCPQTMEEILVNNDMNDHEESEDAVISSDDDDDI